MLILGKKRGRILSYDAKTRTARVHVFGLTDGASNGIPATFMYAVGEYDKDTEIKIDLNREIFVEFEGGEMNAPIIVGYSSHNTGALVGTRRIRQQNIELIADSNIKFESVTLNINCTAEVNIKSDTKVSVSAPLISMNGM